MLMKIDISRLDRVHLVAAEDFAIMAMWAVFERRLMGRLEDE